MQTSGSPDSRRLDFAVRFDAKKGNHPVLVWEEQIVDGQPQKTARVEWEHRETDDGDAADAEDRSHWRTLRLVAGPDHRVVLPASALLGAALVLAADAVARTVMAPAELPLGVLTALIGVPMFLAMLRHFRDRV